MDYILERIYHINEPRPARTRPLEVICVGLSRSGTESLREALLNLGYQKVYHGWETLKPTNRADFMLHSQILHKKYRSGDHTGNVRLTAEDFDALIGEYDGLTDMDGAVFAADLIEAYPKAKVILNYRKDLAAWHTSILATFGTLQSSWMFWFMSHFNADLYWSRRYIFREMIPIFFRGNLTENGKWIYREHMAMVRGLVPPERLLEWTVEDGYEPLCKFLGKDIPTTEFPKGNMPAQFAKTVAEGQKEHLKKAARNFLLTFSALVAIGAALFYRFGKR